MRVKCECEGKIQCSLCGEYYGLAICEKHDPHFTFGKLTLHIYCANQLLEVFRGMMPLLIEDEDG